MALTVQNISSANVIRTSIPPTTKGFTTGTTYWLLHERNIEHKTNIRGMVNYLYNQLLRETEGLSKNEIPGGEDLDRLGLDTTTVILHPELYYQAYQKILNFYNDSSAFNVPLTTGDFFEILHDRNVKQNANIRGQINHLYNKWLIDNHLNGVIPGGDELEALGMDQSTAIVHQDLYFIAFTKLSNQVVKVNPSKALSLNEVNKLIINKIKEFWENEIKDRYIYHGSHTIYRKHIQKHGLNSEKPIRSIVNRVIAFYQRNVGKLKTNLGGINNYFRWFTERHQSQNTVVSFTFDTWRADEFSKGARRGGEWIYCLRQLVYFLDSEKGNQPGSITLTEEDQKDLKYCKSLINLIFAISSMRIKVKCSCSDFDSTSNYCLGSFSKFEPNAIYLVQSSQFDNIESVFDRVREEWINPKYQIVIHTPIASENIEYDIDKGEDLQQTLDKLNTNTNANANQSEADLKALDIPILNFDEKKRLSMQEMLKLKIFAHNHLSDVPFYKDSQFECQNEGDQYKYWYITRRRCPPELAASGLEEKALEREILQEINDAV